MNFDYNRDIHSSFLFAKVIGAEDIAQREQEKLLNFEAEFLPSPAKLKKMAIQEKWSAHIHSDQPIIYEAMIEIRYLTDILLHHRRWYYRLNKTLIDDNIYDALANRLRYLGKFYPSLMGKDHPVLNHAGY